MIGHINEPFFRGNFLHKTYSIPVHNHETIITYDQYMAVYLGYMVIYDVYFWSYIGCVMMIQPIHGNFAWLYVGHVLRFGHILVMLN